MHYTAPGKVTLIEGSHRALLHDDSSVGQRRLTVVARWQALQKAAGNFGRPLERARFPPFGRCEEMVFCANIGPHSRLMISSSSSLHYARRMIWAEGSFET